MNNERRKKLTKAYEYISMAYSIIEEVIDEEETAKDNLPESLQDRERYYDMEQCVDDLNEALSALDDIDSYIGNYRYSTAEERKQQREEELKFKEDLAEQKRKVANVK